ALLARGAAPLAAAARRPRAPLRVHALRARRGGLLHVRPRDGDLVLVRPVRRVLRASEALRDVDRRLRRHAPFPRALHAEPRDPELLARARPATADRAHRAATRVRDRTTARAADDRAARGPGVRRVPPRARRPRPRLPPRGEPDRPRGGPDARRRGPVAGQREPA